jgi:hypothetical protein
LAAWRAAAAIFSAEIVTENCPNRCFVICDRGRKAL